MPITVPGAPSAMIALAGDGFAVVEWAAPIDDGGAAIGSYSVVPSSGSVVVVSGAPPATVAVVAGLANGTAYTFTVLAHNSAGDGPASVATTPVTPVPPSVPPTRYVTGEYALQTGIDAQSAQMLYADAAQLYEQVSATPMVSYTALLLWAMSQWRLADLPIGRVQAALGMMVDSRLVVPLTGVA